MASRILNVVKTIVISYALTCVILLALSFGVYKFDLSDWQITTGIIITYIAASFIGGFIIATREKNRRILWGMGVGLIYFLILAVASIAVNKGIAIDTTEAVRALLICAVSGAAGAFFTR